MMASYTGPGDRPTWRDRQWWRPDAKGQCQCQACQDARWRPTRQARKHEDTQVHRRNMEYRQSSSSALSSRVLPRSSSTSTHSVRAAPTVTGDMPVDDPGRLAKESDFLSHLDWEPFQGEIALDGVTHVHKPIGGPSWLNAGTNTRLRGSPREWAVLDVARLLEEYLELCEVPADQRSDQSDEALSDADSRLSASEPSRPHTGNTSPWVSLGLTM
ncbi:hypothetical protein JB92DRAFT_2921001 [Gautieria morchelliformis]|nr:hypothetical protein JB92DRAFT_2921001 [Gautieria morchelliformis]